MTEKKKTEEPLESRVLKWLHEGGFPLELRVGRVCQAHGWRVHHAKGYRDPLTDKTREIDIVATRTLVKKLEGKTPAVSLNLVIECKTSPDKPWVLFHNPENFGALWLTLIGSEQSGETSGLIALGAKHQVSLPAPFDLNPIMVHGAVRAFASAKDGDPTGPYSAFQGVLTAMKALSNDADLTNSIRLGALWLQMWAPLVVVAGELFCYRLDTTGAEQLERMEAADVVLPSSTTNVIDRVSIVTEDGLPDMLVSLTTAADRFLEAVTSDLTGLQEIAATASKALEARANVLTTKS